MSYREFHGDRETPEFASATSEVAFVRALREELSMSPPGTAIPGSMAICDCFNCERRKAGFLVHSMDATFHSHPETKILACDCSTCGRTLDAVYAHSWRQATGYNLPPDQPQPDIWAVSPSNSESDSSAEPNSPHDSDIEIQEPTSPKSNGSIHCWSDDDSDLPMAPLTQRDPATDSNNNRSPPHDQEVSDVSPPTTPPPTVSPKTPVQAQPSTSSDQPPKPPTKTKRSLSMEGRNVRWIPIQFKVDKCFQCNSDECPHIDAIKSVKAQIVPISDSDTPESPDSDDK